MFGDKTRPADMDRTVEGSLAIRRRAIVALALCASVITVAANAGPAYALQVAQHQFSSNFIDGSSSAGPFESGISDLAVDQSTGSVYVVDAPFGPGAPTVLDKFDESGAASPFAAPALEGSSSLSTPANASRIAVDNSGTSTQGRIYLTGVELSSLDDVLAFNSDGTEIAELIPSPDSSACGIAVDGDSNLWLSDCGFPAHLQHHVEEITAAGVRTGAAVDFPGKYNVPGRVAIDSHNNLYVIHGGSVEIYTPAGEYQSTLDPGNNDSAVAVDPVTNDVYVGRSGEVAEYNSQGIKVDALGVTPPGVGQVVGVAVNPATGTVYVASANEVSIYQAKAPVTLPEPVTQSASSVTPSGAVLHGAVDPEGVSTTECKFEWGTETSYGNVAPCSQGNTITGSTPQSVTAAIGGLAKGASYHFRLSVSNVNGTLTGRDETVSASAPPVISEQYINHVHSDSVVFHANIDPEGGPTTYRVEYGSTTEYGTVTPVASAGAGLAGTPQSLEVKGLVADTTYHYRITASNESETVHGPDQTFTTFQFTPLLSDPCVNAHVRQQTGATLLADCRAYELVSPPNTGGYDVESDLASGESPLPGYPEAVEPGRVLYGVHDGAVSGTGHPTNHGVAPYIATRGENGWSTEYVGIPANNPFSTKPFSSIPSAASSNLETFAFGGPEGCSPCFEGDYTGIPVRLPSGQLVQGMVGAPGFEPGPTATPDGHIAQDLSANGEHLIFGSTSRFAAGGNDETGDVSIYDRNLLTDETHVISNIPGAEDLPTALPCLQGTGKCDAKEGDENGISELAISGDGNRILLGQKVSEDADGNVYYHLYMDIGDSIRSIDLTPGVISTPGGPGFKGGVLFDGMTQDGSRVYFSTKDALSTASNQDTDESTDIYRADVSEGSATLTRVSTGTEGTGNTDACDPASNKNGPHWNAIGAEENCSAVAIGGGGGVAAESGSIYFLSPERLDGASNGIENQPNLYLAVPGSEPRFIATLDPEDPEVLDALSEAGTRHTADFQVTPSGDYAAFPTTLSLDQSYDNAGHAEIYRYAAQTDKLACASCDPTGARATGDAGLPANGLGLSDDGRVFFNSTDPLAPSDLDEKQDVYEWEPLGAKNCLPGTPSYSKSSETCLSLISTGTSAFASSLLGVSANGSDAYFFTRDSLVPQDENGELVKIYDAREAGGFAYAPPSPPCAASDECHGPGSQAPGPPSIKSVVGEGGNLVVANCSRGHVKRHGTCVIRHPKKKPHRRGRHHNRQTGKHHG